MNKLIILALVFILFTTIAKCQSNIDVDSIINYDSPMILTQTKTNNGNGLTHFSTDTININADKWINIIEFFKRNQHNWKSTPASYNPDFALRQDKFNLIGWIGGSSVVLTFTDNQGHIRQFAKNINKGELDFLTN